MSLAIADGGNKVIGCIPDEYRQEGVDDFVFNPDFSRACVRIEDKPGNIQGYHPDNHDPRIENQGKSHAAAKIFLNVIKTVNWLFDEPEQENKVIHQLESLKVSEPLADWFKPVVPFVQPFDNRSGNPENKQSQNDLGQRPLQDGIAQFPKGFGIPTLILSIFIIRKGIGEVPFP